MQRSYRQNVKIQRSPVLQELFPTSQNSKPDGPQYGSNLPIWDVAFQSVSIAWDRWYLVVKTDGIQNANHKNAKPTKCKVFGNDSEQWKVSWKLKKTDIRKNNHCHSKWNSSPKSKTNHCSVYTVISCLRLMSWIQKVQTVYTYIYIYFFIFLHRVLNNQF